MKGIQVSSSEEKVNSHKVNNGFFFFSLLMLLYNHMCLLIWTVFSGERCGPWASCFLNLKSKSKSGEMSIRVMQARKTVIFFRMAKKLFVVYMYFYTLFVNRQALLPWEPKWKGECSLWVCLGLTPLMNTSSWRWLRTPLCTSPLARWDFWEM